MPQVEPHDIQIHGFAPSTYVRTARLVAHEKGLPYDLVPLAFGSDDHLARHPFGKMPLLSHGDLWLYETVAIALYLDEAFPGPALQPTDTRARAGMWRLISLVTAYAYPALVSETLGNDGLDGADQAAIARVLDALEPLVADATTATDGVPSLAALFLAPVLSYHQGLAGAASLFDGRPALSGWFARLAMRPSFQETDPQ